MASICTTLQYILIPATGKKLTCIKKPLSIIPPFLTLKRETNTSILIYKKSAGITEVDLDGNRTGDIKDIVKILAYQIKTYMIN